MKELILTDIHGKEVTRLDLPESPEEVKFRQLINFTKTLTKVAEANQDTTPHEYLRSLVDVLAEFFETEKEIFKDIDLQGMDDNQTITSEASVANLINYCMHVCRYEPKARTEEDFRFEYQGETFEIPFYRASAYIKGLTKRPDLGVGEVTEAIEMERIKSALLKEDPDGSELFTKSLAQIAILCRKPGESFPENPASAREFITDRMHFFKDITVPIALDVAFFLKFILKILNKRRRSQTSSTRRSRSRIQKKKAKR